MKQIFDQLLQLLQQGIAAILRFIHLIWTWSIDQITKIFQVPWDSWPLWKQILLILVIAAVIFVVYKAAIELWAAGIKVLRAFASLLVAFVMTLPTMLLAGAIALGGLWAINNLHLSFSQWPTFTSIFQGSNSKTDAPPRGATVGRGSNQSGEADREGNN
jgi:hypothetical protein